MQFQEKSKWDYNWDRRHFENSDKKIETKRRHGQYENKVHDSERVLTEKGRIQAKLVGQRMKEMKFTFNKVWVSTMVRASETAKIIESCFSEPLPIEHSDLIREVCPADPVPPLEGYDPAESELFQETICAEAGFRQIFHRPDVKDPAVSYEMVVCHGNLIRYWTLRALQLDPQGWLRIGVHNCSVTWITIAEDGKVSIKTLGDFGHLPKEFQTFN
ncbi:Serine/threonine-protein phosphatase pgam5, mitochondrial [Lobulomyces angularis]|nr:Serine/threonine-protein phosphatase pgam5, mitochondrial [Lobulomyces angularis]